MCLVKIYALSSRCLHESCIYIYINLNIMQSTYYINIINIVFTVQSISILCFNFVSHIFYVRIYIYITQM